MGIRIWRAARIQGNSTGAGRCPCRIRSGQQWRSSLNRLRGRFPRWQLTNLCRRRELDTVRILLHIHALQALVNAVDHRTGVIDQSHHFAHRHIRLRAARDKRDARAVKAATGQKGIRTKKSMQRTRRSPPFAATIGRQWFVCSLLRAGSLGLQLFEQRNQLWAQRHPERLIPVAAAFRSAKSNCRSEGVGVVNPDVREVHAGFFESASTSASGRCRTTSWPPKKHSPEKPQKPTTKREALEHPGFLLAVSPPRTR